MKTVLHKANTRGIINHGWLQAKHTFSFGSYHNPKRMQFGALRVLNDDTVAPGMGFGTHPHRDMEIISIPLEGDLEHKDNMGNTAVIKSGDIQAMSAGTGITHSEYNKSLDKEVKLLQIWIIPKENGVEPRYDQITLKVSDRYNKLQQVLSPRVDDQSVWIHQNAWFYLSDLDQNKKLNYPLKDFKNNGVYVFVLQGDVNINGQDLNSRDGFGLWDIKSIDIQSNSDVELLLMEVPMNP